MTKTNVQILQDAKVLPTPHKLSQADVDFINNNLNQTEVIAVASVKGQLGDDFIKRNTSFIL